jgi:hypothetical protein
MRKGEKTPEKPEQIWDKPGKRTAKMLLEVVPWAKN